MSRKQIYGITLTAEERRMAGYDRTSGFARATTNVPASTPRQPGITSHACRVTLPDGTTCQVSYTRYGSGGHTFQFYAPLGEREYGQEGLTDREGIEARAQALVGRMWRRAQAAEQKTMCLPSAPSSLVHTLDKTPQLTQKTAKQFAGLYAVCLRYPSGILTPLSGASDKRTEALSDLSRMQAENKQTLVVGLCCRWARRWQEPRFLLDAPDANDARDTAGAIPVDANALGANAANANVPVSRPQAQAGREDEEQDREEDADAPDTDHDGVKDEEEEEEEEEDYGEEDYDYPDEPDPDEADPDDPDPGDPFEAARSTPPVLSSAPNVTPS